MQHKSGQSWFFSFISREKEPSGGTHLELWNSSCTHAMCTLVHSCSPPGPGRGFARGSWGHCREAGEPVEESEEIQRSLWIQRNSSPPPRLLWETSGACGESEVRRGLSGTKLQIHMICLAKRAKEKWIKAWRDQRNTTIKSRRLPWDQQEMHIIYKFFLSSVRCGGNWLLLFGGRAAAGGG